MKKFSRNHHGFSLVEMLVVIGVMSVVMLAFISMQDNQMKSNNYLEFQLKKTQLQSAIEGLVLTDPASCGCLFAGANPFPSAPAAPGATLAGYAAPAAIGRYSAGCAAIPLPLVTTAGFDGLRLNTVQLTNIQNVSGAYLGDLVVDISPTKQVAGPGNLTFRTQVNINTSPAGANVNFVSCSLKAQSPIPAPTIVRQIIGCGGWVQVAATCPVGLKPISCGVHKPPSGNEDWVGCWIDQPTNSCIGERDQSGGCDGGAWVDCSCI